MTIVLGVICLALIGAIVYLARQGALERQEWAAERSGLLQRIQAPERAIAEHATPAFDEPARVLDLEDDAAFAELREEQSA